MSYQVIARKWRPQNFDEVVYQDHISRTLKNSIANGRISHAYLFAGPRGVGKTTMARILAKAVNCANGPTADPCNRCEQCLEIKRGAAFDVIEIDGASNRGIEDIRELRENVNFAPVKSRYKVYIIDEVHMLTKEAFNALLKTLEEPPAHVVFIFATTEIHQIPETILSRCQKYFFKKIPIEPIVRHLKNIVDREGYRISDRALYPLARAAEGSMRDAQSLLDQAISFSQVVQGIPDGEAGTGEINEEDSLAILGIVPLESYIRQLQFVVDGDAAAAMEEVERVVTMGVDIPRYGAGFIDVIRALRLVRNGVQLEELLGLAAEEIELLGRLAGSFHDEELSAIFHIIQEMQQDLRYAGNERVNLEMAILDMITVKKTPSIASIIARLEQGGSGHAAPASPGPDPRKKAGGEPPKKAAPDPARAEETPKARDEKKPGQPAQTSAPVSDAAVTGEWTTFLEGIKTSRQYLHFLLAPAQVRLEGTVLHLVYPDGSDHAYHRKVIEADNLGFIREEMSRRLDKNLELRIGVQEAPASAPAQVKEQRPASARPAAQSVAPLPDEKMMPAPEQGGDEKNSPTVEKLKDAFFGQIIDKEKDDAQGSR